MFTKGNSTPQNTIASAEDSFVAFLMILHRRLTDLMHLRHLQPILPRRIFTNKVKDYRSFFPLLD
jgi:hypothetical protein